MRMKSLTIVVLTLLATSGNSPVDDGTAYQTDLALTSHGVDGARTCPAQLKRLEAVKSLFRPVDVPSQPAGWATAHAAALAFYAHHDAAYHGTRRQTELVGFLLKTDERQFYFTNAVEVPYAFRLSASIERPSGWTIGGFLHTHPGGHDCQEEFSTEDRETVLRGAVPANYVRTPSGDVRFLNRRLARLTYTRRGAMGRSVCPEGKHCLAAYGMTEDAGILASR